MRICSELRPITYHQIGITNISGLQASTVSRPAGVAGSTSAARRERQNNPHLHNQHPAPAKSRRHGYIQNIIRPLNVERTAEVTRIWGWLFLSVRHLSPVPRVPLEMKITKDWFEPRDIATNLGTGRGVILSLQYSTVVLNWDNGRGGKQQERTGSKTTP
jgi:hypothetical protein